MPEELFMVFDVESIGLHGDGFAVGWVLISNASRAIGSGILSSDPAAARGTEGDHHWVQSNIPSRALGELTRKQVLAGFWGEWRWAKRQGAILVADCAWPVETRFLAACIDDDPLRAEDSPYPLHELASFLLAAGMDPLGDYGREENELPKHDPLADARQSARVLTMALKKLRGAP